MAATKISKNDLLNALAAKTGMTKVDCEKLLDALATVVAGKTLDEGVAVPVAGLGLFLPNAKAARTGRNPKTGETIQIAASKTIQFKPAGALKRGA